jgi:hypothetical protein
MHRNLQRQRERAGPAGSTAYHHAHLLMEE